VKEILKEKRIDWLLHFTRAENLENIFKYGLLPRSDLDNMNIESNYNDQYRYDKCKNASCLSIQFPNYKMFYGLREDNPKVDWAVLLLRANILYEFECAFCQANAGSEQIYTIPINKRKGKDAFLKLFEEIPNRSTRKELEIGSCYPTNPQAEVLVFEKIPITYIEEVYFKNQKELNKYKDIVPNTIEAKVSNRAFSCREDYSNW
jgi:hypothetical protein